MKRKDSWSSGKGNGKKKKKKRNLQKHKAIKEQEKPYEEKIKYESILKVLFVVFTVLYLIALATRAMPGYDTWIGMPRNWIRP